MKKIVLVSQAPGRANGDPLAGTSGKKLASLAGLDVNDFLKLFERVNLIDKAGRFDARAALDRADQLREELDGRRAVLLGRLVARAFRLRDEDYEWFKPIQLPPNLEVAVMPHPSGISHFWNNAEVVRVARDFMLRVKVGLLKDGRNGKERFTKMQVAAALDAARGILTTAAEILAEETGRSCSYQTMTKYLAKYPDLADIGHTHVSKILDRATHHVIAGIEAGDPDYVRWLYRTKVAREHVFSTSTLNVEGRVDHRHSHSHVHATLEQIADKLTDQELDVLEGVYRRLSESDVAPALTISDVGNGSD